MNMAKIYLGLGSNLGDKKKNITNATIICHSLMGPIVALSDLFTTEPWGFDSDNKFMNAVAVLETEQDPQTCLDMACAIEREMGRTRKSVNGEYHDRIIDIDILLYDDKVVDTPALKIPHPLMHKRNFVMKPLAQVAPELVHPTLGKTMQQLLHELTDLN